MNRSTSAGRSPLALPFAALLAACAGTTPPPAPYTPRQVVELARWHVISAGRPIGLVRHLEIRDPAGPLPFYRIEDLDGHWLGHASPEGRFTRRVPFQEHEEDLGVWSLASGVRRLLDAGAEVSLRPVAVDAVFEK